MSEINQYLTRLSKQLMLADAQIKRIEISISYLRSKLWSVFQDKLESVFVYGSYDRQTIIPVDADMDVDVMVLFKQNKWKPDTYLKQISDFCIKHYSTSVVYRDRPSITIELDHIKFEIIPAYNSEDQVKIPAKKGDEVIWISTSPQDFKNAVLTKDKNNNKFILPSIRLYKYWNLLNNKPFLPYEIEKYIVEKTYYFIFSTPSLEEYFLAIANDLQSIAKNDKQKESVKLLQEKIKDLQQIVQNNVTQFDANFSAYLPQLI